MHPESTSFAKHSIRNESPKFNARTPLHICKNPHKLSWEAL